MRIGSITVSWTKVVQEQAARQGHDNDLHRAMIRQLTTRNIEVEALLRRWGVDNGVFGQGEGYQGSMPPLAMPPSDIQYAERNL
jgi:hypothetical protein